MNREKNWHELSTAELERRFRTDSATGLSEKEAQRRLRHTQNNVWELKTASAKKYAIRSFLDLTGVLLVLCVIALAFFGYGDMALGVCIMLCIGRVFRIALYIKAERILEKNALSSLPRAKVVRGGNVLTVPSRDVVCGDVIILDSGDTVPCDIRLTAADSILVSENRVTGIEGIISKSSQSVLSENSADIPISERTNMVYASSVIISGFAIGIAVAVGDDTLIVSREGRIEISGENDVSTVEKLSDWGRVCSICLMAAALVITALDIIFGGHSLVSAFLPSIALAAAGLSEYISAVGAWAWAKKLSSDKETVLTKASRAEKAANTEVMVLRSVDVLKSTKTTLHSYYKDGELKMMGTEGAYPPAELLRLACYCTGASPEGSIVSGAFDARVSTQGILPYRLVRSLWDDNKEKAKGDCEKYTIVAHKPAGEMGAIGLDTALLALNNDFYFAVSGSVERVLSLSTFTRMGRDKIPLSPEEANKIGAFAKELRKHGVTIAAVASRSSHYNNLNKISVLQANLCFEGFIAVADRPAEGVCDELWGFRRAGGRLVIFSENGEEELCYAKAEGVFETGDIYFEKSESATVKALELEGGKLTFIETPGGAEGIRERLRFVKLCKESTLCVTYVGYGVEDMWNMKNADVSFAVPDSSGLIPQGIRSEAHGIADSSNGGLGEVCKIIGNCRKAINNIKNVLRYLIASHSARLVLMLLCAASGLGLPSAACVILWGVVIDLCIAFAGADSPGSASISKLDKGKVTTAPSGKREVFFPTMYGALVAVLSVAAPFFGAMTTRSAGFDLEISDSGVMTVIFISAIIAMPFIGADYAGAYGLFSKSSRLSKTYIIPFAVTVLSAVYVLFFGERVFGTTFEGWIMTVFTLLPSAVIVTVMALVRAAGKKKK